MKLLYLLAFFFGITSGLTAQTNPNFTLAANGVTCLCPDATIDESGDLVIDGEIRTFTKRDRDQLLGLIGADQADPEIALTCTSGITDMNTIFYEKRTFNQDISSWDVSGVTNMRGMFYLADAFNQPLNDWDVSGVTDMTSMFNTLAFNQPLNDWDVSGVTDMTSMFLFAKAFNQDISGWCVEQIISEPTFFSLGSPLQAGYKPKWGQVCVASGEPGVVTVENFNSFTNGAPSFESNCTEFLLTNAYIQDGSIKANSPQSPPYEMFILSEVKDFRIKTLQVLAYNLEESPYTLTARKNGVEVFSFDFPAVELLQTIDFTNINGIDYSQEVIDEIVISNPVDLTIIISTFEWEAQPNEVYYPLNTASDAIFGQATTSTISLNSFTAPADGADGYLIYLNDTNTFSPPTNGSAVSPSSTWAGAGQQAVYKGTSVNPGLSLTGLDPGTTYYVQIYAYNDCSGSELYEPNGYGSTFATTSNTAPSFTSTPVTSVKEGDAYTYNVTTDDADGDEVSVTATTLPSWLSFTSEVLVSSFAGSGAFGFADGDATTAEFKSLNDVAVDALGNVYVSDNGNHSIRKITSAGEVSTLAGSGVAGFADGTGTNAQFRFPAGVAVDAAGNVYVSDYSNHRIRKITSAGVVSTFAGSTQGFADGTGTNAQFNSPYGVAVDASGNVYVVDEGNHSIRKITPAGEVSTLAGSGAAGFADGTGTAAQFRFPAGVALDAAGNVYVSDYSNQRIRKITPAGDVSTLAGSGVQGFAEGVGTTAQFNNPRGITVDASGNVYVGDQVNHRIRKITPSGTVSTLAGSTQGYANGAATSAQFANPFGVDIDASGTVYVADGTNYRVRLITQNTSLTGTPTSTDLGDHQVVLQASDGSGGVSNQSFTITVNDITPPVITSVSVPANATYTAGQNLDFTVNFNENVTVDTASGSPQLDITIGTTARQAVYQSGSGTTALVFRYTVQVGDVDTDGIAVGALAANGGTLRDTAGNDADLTLNNIANTSGVLVDAPATLTVTGLTATDKPYDGSTVASVTGTAVLSSNVQPGDDVILSGTPVYTFINKNVGIGITVNTTGYTITGADAGKYTLTQPILSADITPRPITITAQSQSKIYGTALTLDNTAFTVTDLDSDSVLPNGEVIDAVSLSSASGVAASTTADTGTYADELLISSPSGSNGFSVENYSFTYVAGDLVVTPAEQTGLVFANNSFTYDGSVKSLVVTGQAADATVTYTNNDKINAGTYAVTATVTRPNYTTAVLNASLSITKAEAVITADAVQIFTYDGTVKTISASLNHTETTLIYTPQQGYTNAGSYPITVSAAETANYLATSEDVSLVIEPATQTGLVFANNSFTYDGSIKSLIVTGQAADATVTYTNNDQIDAGTYAVTATVTRPNYTTAVLNATLSINKAEAVITASVVQTFTYDGTVKNVSASLNHTETALTYTPQQGYTDADSYPITISAAETANYLAASENVSLVIEPAMQTGLVFANNSFTYDGSVKSLVVTGQAADATVTYTNNDQIDAGIYAVTATVSRPNYTTAVLNATLSITKAEAVITASVVQTFTYDGTVKTISASLNHNETTLTYSPQQAYTDAGIYPVTIEAEATTNYMAASQSVELIINKAAQSITFDALGTLSLEEDSDFQLEATASSGLEVTYSYSYSSSAPPATVTPSGFVELQTSGEIIITATQAGNSNFEAATSVEQVLMITSSNAEATSIIIDGEILNNPGDEVYFLLDCETTANFVDIEVIAEVNTQVSPGLNFRIDTPVPGIYIQEVVVTSQDGTQTRTYKIVVEKAFDFDSIVVQKYNNTLVVNNNPETNGGYSFMSYQWYKNGVLVSVRQAFSEGNRSSDILDPNATYQAVMVTTSGDELRTCISSAKFSSAQGLSLHQNPVNKGDALRVIAQFPKDELKNAIFQVYDLNGRLLVSVPVSGVENTIELPVNMATGLYKLILITNQRQESISFMRN